MNISIKKIEDNQINHAIDIFSEAFFGDPLFIFAFPEEEIRRKMTKIMYEFVVLEMVPRLNLKLIGAFFDDKLAGCTVFTTPESNEWNEQMMDAINIMREKANDKRINYIGEYSRVSAFEPEGEYFYGNELAVSKDFRKHGIGKTLNNYLFEECKKHPTAAGILIDTANKNNVKLYEKWGWELKATLDFYDIKKYFLWKNK